MRCTVFAAVLGVGFVIPAGASGDSKPLQIASLEHSLRPLKTHFNLHADQPRVVAILSPS